MLNIIISSMYRAGSTLCYNIVSDSLEAHHDVKKSLTSDGCEVNGVGIHKHHQETPSILKSNDTVIYLYRDILDTLVSYCQRKNTNFSTFNLHGWDAIEYINIMIKLDNEMKSYPIKKLDLCYEETILDVKGLCKKLESFLEIQIPYSNSYEINNVKSITSNLDKHNLETNYHPNHVKDGKIGKWKSFINENDLEKVYKNTNYLEWKRSRYK